MALKSAKFVDSLLPTYLQVDSGFAKALRNTEEVSISSVSDQHVLGSRQILEMSWKLFQFIIWILDN